MKRRISPEITGLPAAAEKSFLLASTLSSFFTFSDLTLVDGAEIVINWLDEEEEKPESLELDKLTARMYDVAGNILESFAVGGDFAGYKSKLSNGVWMVYAAGPESSVPEPAAWLLLLLGLVGLRVGRFSSR